VTPYAWARMSSSPLGQPYDYAIARLAAAGGDLAALLAPVRTLLVVESVQSMIDTGGLEYLYEADFPNNPPYALFVEAYRRIGADGAAACLEASALLFPFDEPHCFEELRILWLERLRRDPDGAFQRLDAGIRGDATVWARLADYVALHRGDFAED
jgi:hypothetical protein